MAAVNGIGGNITFASEPQNLDLNVRSWSLDYVADTLDTTDFTSTGDRTFISGLRSWSGTFEAFLDGTTTPLTNSSDMGISGIITLQSASGRIYLGTMILSGMHPSVTVDGVNTVTVDFQGTDNLLIT